MQLLIEKSIENGIFSVTITNKRDKISQNDQELIERFGEPTINIGGVFLEGDPEEFTIPAKYVRIVSDLPYTQSFDSRDEPFTVNTQDFVALWQTAFLDRFDAAVGTLRASYPGFVGDELHSV